MQGRLSIPSEGKIQSFPKNNWAQEFEKAKQVGLKGIEWIFEADKWEKNPISSDDGIKNIKEVINETGIIIDSVCADYFMDVPYFTASSNTKKELTEKLKWLISQTAKIGACYVDIPFVDASKIQGIEQFNLLKEFILPSISLAEKINITLALETSLEPEVFNQLLLFFNNPKIMANYDTGNSSGIGYNCVDELKTYGKFIKTIHIKDRLINNGTRPLGTGSADFNAFFKELYKLKYKGPIVLQSAREEEGGEIETAIKNKVFVEKYLKKYKIEWI